MNKNIFCREMKSNRKAFLLWTLITGLLYFVTLTAYPALINSQDLGALIEMFPEELLKAFNMDLANISTPFGWLATEGLTFYLLAGGVYAGILGSTILLKEESDRTIEFLYAKPVTKNRIVTAKLLCAGVYLTAFTLLVGLASMLALFLNDDLDFGKTALLLWTPAMIFFCLFFITFLLSTFMRKTKNAIVISFALVFFSYFLQIAGTISDKVEFLKYASPFTFSDSRHILQEGGISPWSVVIFLLLSAILCLLSYRVYGKKEYL